MVERSFSCGTPPDLPMVTAMNIDQSVSLLLINDERALPPEYRKALERPGIRVGKAGTVEGTNVLLKRKECDIVVADIRPTAVLLGDALEILKYVGEQRPGTKVVIITGNGSPGIREKAYSLSEGPFLERQHSL
jgi:DNA-binding NtrC family response regulator